MLKARNGIRHPATIKQKAILLRTKGKTHREISKKLGISLGTAHLWTKNIGITPKQKKEIEQRRNKRQWNEHQKAEIAKRLKQYRTKYSDEDLLNKIKRFYEIYERIPLKREFNAWHIYTARFGSWNKAVIAAGFDPNPVLFSKKFIAKDGHTCHSFTEKVIDDWFFAHDIKHERHVCYRGTKFTADFLIEPNVFIEFFGLAGAQKSYDAIIEKKRYLSKKLKYQLIEIYPDDIYPKNKLSTILSHSVGV